MNFTIDNFQITGPSLVLGVITGMTYGILAVGLVIIYRQSRVINFAYGETGAFGASILGIAVVTWHLPYWVAFLFAIIVAAGIGGLSEVLIIRRLRNAPLMVSVIATLGLAEFLDLFATVLNSKVQAGNLFPQPPGLPQFSIGPLLVTRAYSAMLIVTPIVVVVLVVFFRKARYGMGLRAAAANPDAASMSGLPAGVLSVLGWAIAGALAAYTASLILPTRGFNNTQLLGPSLLLRALAAAVIARMVSMPIALVAGIGIGVIEESLLWNYPSGGSVDAVLFGIIMIALLVQRRRRGRDEDKGVWAAVRPWAPTPKPLTDIFVIRNLSRILGFVALGLAILMPVVLSNTSSQVLTFIMCFSVVGLSLGVISGLAGELSLGQFALAGVGATASYVVTAHTGDFLLAFGAAGITGVLVSLAIGLPALRIRGLMLGVVTLGFAIVTENWLLQQKWMLGAGVASKSPVLGSFRFDTPKRYYYLALVFLLFGLWLAWNVRRGGIGRRLRSLRDNEDGARAFTIPTTLVKLQAFAFAGFLAGLAGAMWAETISYVASTSFPQQSSTDVVAMTALGGLGVLFGPILGAFYIVGIPQWVPLDSAGMAATALGWLGIVVQFPGGIAQMLAPARRRLLDFLARRSGVDPTGLWDEVAGGESADFTAAVALPSIERPPPDPAMLLLEVTDLSKTFGGITAVNGVTLGVPGGQTLGLIGPNGAGKSTLFELISGFTKPDSGKVLFAGKDVSTLPPDRRGKLGLIRSFQDAALFPTMSVDEVIMLALERSDPTRFLPALVGLPYADRLKAARSNELINMMGLNRYRNTQIQELSTGTRRIVELTCLMALDPVMLLLDEPSSGIAQRETEALGILLRRVKTDLKLTLIVIEHDIPLIMGLADRVVAMEAGRIIADGTPAEVRNDASVVESYLGGDLAAIERSSVGT